MLVNRLNTCFEISVQKSIDVDFNNLFTMINDDIYEKTKEEEDMSPMIKMACS